MLSCRFPSVICFCLFLVASFTFYLANTFPELGSAKGTDDNVISFVSLDNSEIPFSGSGYEDPTGTLTVSNVTSEGFDLAWESNKHIGYDSYTVELKDFSGKWKEEVHLHGEVNDTKIRGLKASTEYQVRLYGISNNQRSSLLEAVAVTGINFILGFKSSLSTITTFFCETHRFKNGMTQILHDIQYATAPICHMVEHKDVHDDASEYGCVFGLGDATKNIFCIS